MNTNQKKQPASRVQNPPPYIFTEIDNRKNGLLALKYL